MLIPILVIILLLLNIFFLVVGWTAFDPWLPKELVNQYLHSVDSSEPAFLSTPAFFIFDGVLIIIYFASLIGVAFRSKVAIFVYAASVALSLVYAFWPQIQVISAPMAFIDTVSSILTGILIAMGFSSLNIPKAEQGAAANP